MFNDESFVTDAQSFNWFGAKNWREKQRERTEDTFKELLPRVQESLDQSRSVDEVLTHLARIDSELFSNRWGDVKLSRSVDFTYDVTPLECDEYCYIKDKFISPAIDKLVEMSKALRPEDKVAVVTKIENYIQDKYDYNVWYLDRAADLTLRLLDIAGVEALPAMLRVSENLVGGGANEGESDLSRIMLEFGSSDHRNFHSALVEAIGNHTWEKEDQKTIAAMHLSNLLGSGSEGNLGTYVVAFEALGLGISIPYLLKNLKDENLLARRMSAEILFRLELGERSVEYGEVEIFGKIFKLATEKGQQHLIETLQAARRLDSHGRWAVFDESGGTKGIFTIDSDDLSPQGNRTVEKSIDFELSNLFREACIRRVDETPKDRAVRERVFSEYLEHFSQVIDGMHERTGVWLNSLELHEQAFFVHVYRQAVAEGRDTEIEGIIRNYGEEALKVFVTMEYGESGDAILDFLGCEDIHEQTKRTILSGYYELSHRADAWRNVFANAELVTGHRFASEVYEAFIRKSSEYFRAAMMIERGEGGQVRMHELIESLSTITYALKVLEGLYGENGGLQLEGKPQVQAECADPECNVLIEDARTTWIFSDQRTGDRIVLSIRPKPTIMVGNRPGGEARINFKVSNKARGLEARIGLDLSDYGEFIGDHDKPAVVSLDLGTGAPDRAEGTYPSHRVGRVLELVEGSEGGHNEASFSAESAQYFEDISNSLIGYLENTFTQ